MTGPYVRFDLERVLKGSCSQNKQTKGEKPLAMPSASLIVQIGSRNCIGFGSGVLGGFAFAFAFWALGSGLWALVCSGLWAGLWALVLAGLWALRSGLGGFNQGLLVFAKTGSLGFGLGWDCGSGF